MKELSEFKNEGMEHVWEMCLEDMLDFEIEGSVRELEPVKLENIINLI